MSEDEKINYRILDLKECAQFYCDNPDNGLTEASARNITSETLLAYITIKKYNNTIEKKLFFTILKLEIKKFGICIDLKKILLYGGRAARY